MSDRIHQILVVKQHPSGAEEWYCPTCNRHYIVQWSPEYQCMILNPGDESAIHNMSRGALVVESPEPAVREESLAPWLHWLDGMDLDQLLGTEEPFDID